MRPPTPELIGGRALMGCRDLEEAVEWAKRFVSVVGEGEVRVRPAEMVGIDGRRGLRTRVIGRRA